MSVIINETEIESMTHNGVEVQTWIHNDVEVYSAGKMVTYYVDTDVVYEEKVKKGQSCISPTTFTPTKSGWTFAGWREDTVASGSVLTEKTMERSPITLYAVFSQTVTATYNGNGSTGGSTSASTGNRYYNNGNAKNPTIALASNAFTRSDYTFSKWAMGSASGTQYTAGTSFELSSSTTFYAVWIRDTKTVTSLGLSKTYSTSYSNNNSSPSITVSGNTVSYSFSNVSYNGATIRAWGTSAIDLADFNKAVITYTADGGTDSLTLGFGTARGTFTKSASGSGGSSKTVTIDVSTLSSAYFGVDWNCSENPNYETSRSYTLTISNIKLSA